MKKAFVLALLAVSAAAAAAADNYAVVFKAQGSYTDVRDFVRMGIESDINFHCCGEPFNDEGCRVAFRRQVSMSFGVLYITQFSSVESLPDRIQQWIDGYVGCNRVKCDESLRRR